MKALLEFLTATPLPQSMQEYGRAVTMQSLYSEEQFSWLVGTKGMEIIDEMKRDDAAGTSIDLKITARLSTDWAFKPASEEEEDVLRADFLTDNFNRMDGSVKQALRGIYSAHYYGFSVQNKPLYIIEDGKFSGKIGIRKIQSKAPHNYRFKLDEFSNIVALLQQDETFEWKELPLDQFIVYTYRGDFSNPYGTSDFQKMWVPWNLKKHARKMWAIYLERFAGSFIHTTYKAGAQTGEEHSKVTNFMSKLSSGRSGLMTSEAYTLNVHEASGHGHDAFKEAIQEFNIWMARAALLPDLLGYSSRDNAGSFAQAKKHFDVWAQIQGDMGGAIEELMFEQVVKPLIDLNYGPTKNGYPKFQFEPFTDEQKEFFFTQLLKAVEKGVITPDLKIENHARELLDLPKKEKTKEPPLPTPPDRDLPTGNGDGGDRNNGSPGTNRIRDIIGFSGHGPEDDMDLLTEIKEFPRVIIVGGPRAGKSTLAVRAGERFGRRVRHSDSLLERQEWSEHSTAVSEWFNDEGDWIIEGVVGPRALRKWLKANPVKELDAAVVFVKGAIQSRSEGQIRMAKGVETVWREIVPELKRRGVHIIETEMEVV